jgi:hypothetical protein
MTNKMCEIIGSRVKKLINAETDQKGYAWAKWYRYKNHGYDDVFPPEYVKFKPNKLKFNDNESFINDINNKWYHYDFAPELVSKIKVYKSDRPCYKIIIYIIDIKVMSIEKAQKSTQLRQIVGNKLIKRTVYKNGIFKFSLLKLLVMKYCSYIREKTWKPGSLQYQLAKERFEL